MPFINVKTNSPLAVQSKEQLKAALGEAITAIPGKSESWLMVNVEETSALYFKGSDAPCALFDVSIFGSASDSAYEELTRRLCAIAETYLDVPADRTYVKATEVAHWGWNNMNF
ncbi:MAG: hypothetical protein IJ168_11030 [Eubacterium sp.]|nr:hypothetical protein [Eubacterium sp.]